MNVRVPISLFILITAVYIVFKNLHYPWVAFPLIEHVYSVLAVTCLGWLTIKIVNFGTLLFLSHFDLKKADNYRARKVHTQVRIFNHILVAFIIFLTILGILVSFKTVRDAGTSILASAGLVSILIGLAAQKTMSNFFAGIQIATAQPIRVDDVVVVENEWGRIEEIHLTFVVVKLWDLRRLIVPITYFTDHIFQNWTQKTADILGAVMLYVDYTMPVKLIREELDKLLEGNELWDGRVKVVQVSNANEQAMEIRILTSSPNSGTSFDLRCAIREHMINFIQKNYPDSLPRIRTEISKEPKFKIEHEPQDVAKEPVRAPAPTLDPHPKPMDPEGAH
jgi:small-conductance mechanosensitive channel